MAKGLIFVGGVFGIWDRNHILLSNTMLCHFAKVAVPQQKLNYTTKKSILPPPDTYSAKEPGNTLPGSPLTQSAATDYAQLSGSSFSNIGSPLYFVRSKVATTLLFPGTPIYLTHLLSSQQLPTLPQPFLILKEPTSNNSILVSNPGSNDHVKDLDLHNSAPSRDVNDDAPGTNEITERVVTSEEKVKVAEKEEEVIVALVQSPTEAIPEEETKEETEVAEKEEEVIVALVQSPTEAIPEEETKEETEVAEKEVKLVQSPTEAAEKTQDQNFHNQELSTVVTTDNAEINNLEGFSSEYEITNETVSIVEEIDQPPEAQINSQNKITSPQAGDNELPSESPTESNLPNNFAPEMPAPSNEQVNNVIQVLTQDQIDQIVQEAKAQELEVLNNLKTFYTELKKELENPPQKLDNSHRTKRELIVKNINNILKDIEKSEKNIDLGISLNRHKALVTENSFNTKKKLNDINAARQLRSEELKKYITQKAQ